MGCLQSTYCNKCGVPLEYYKYRSDSHSTRSCREHNWKNKEVCQKEGEKTPLRSPECHDCDGNGNCIHRWENQWC
jgi:hypothetical protein